MVVKRRRPDQRGCNPRPARTAVAERDGALKGHALPSAAPPHWRCHPSNGLRPSPAAPTQSSSWSPVAPSQLPDGPSFSRRRPSSVTRAALQACQALRQACRSGLGRSGTLRPLPYRATHSPPVGGSGSFTTVHICRSAGLWRHRCTVANGRGRPAAAHRDPTPTSRRDLSLLADSPGEAAVHRRPVDHLALAERATGNRSSGGRGPPSTGQSDSQDTSKDH